LSQQCEASQPRRFEISWPLHPQEREGRYQPGRKEGKEGLELVVADNVLNILFNLFPIPLSSKTNKKFKQIPFYCPIKLSA
jgi:hypothetical protein